MYDKLGRWDTTFVLKPKINILVQAAKGERQCLPAPCPLLISQLVVIQENERKKESSKQAYKLRLVEPNDELSTEGRDCVPCGDRSDQTCI